MSTDYSKVEQQIATSINKLKGEKLPDALPQWLIDNGIKPGATILNAVDIGSASHNNKTDVLVNLDNSNPLKISVKKNNADYYGNWYGHIRMMEVFGEQIFTKLTSVTTEWANNIKNDPTWNNKPFVGVSLNFGKRSGKTKLNFDDVFNEEDILTIARGNGTGDNVANSLLITTDGVINNVNELMNSLEEISIDNILKTMDKFYIVFRPVNPMTEGTNRGKNIYARFVPFKRLNKPTTVTTMSELNQLGTYKTVTPVLERPMLTHNFVLDDLEKNFNIIIPRKAK